MSTASYRLPTPPSVNKLWRPTITKGRKGQTFASLKKRPAYKAWLRQAGLEIMVQRGKQKRMRDDVGIKALYVIERPKALRDLDNYLKALNDALVEFHVIVDDSLIEHIDARFDSTVKGVIIYLEEVAA